MNECNYCNNRNKCGCGVDLTIIPSSFGDDSKTSPAAPKNGQYQDTLVIYEGNGHIYLYTHDGVPTRINLIPKYGGKPMEDDTDIPDVKKAIAKETAARKAADLKLSEKDEDLQEQIYAIQAGSDVTDIVGTYAELQSYDTSKLHDNDIIKVLQDETQGDAISYYRWDAPANKFELIGTQGPYYTQTQTDELLDEKQDKLTAGTGIEIDADNVISILEFSDGTYRTTDTLTKEIADATVIDINDVLNINPDDIVLNETLIYDGDGTVGVVTSFIDPDLNVVTITTADSKDISFIAPAYDDTQTYSEGDVVTYDGKRYVANTDINIAEPWTPAHWTEEDVQTAIDALGDGDSTAKYNYTTNIEVGGVPVGTEIHDTDLLADIVKQMLVTTYYPTYTAPSAAIAYSVNTYVEVGTNVPAKTATVTYNAGAITLQGAKQNDRGGAATQYAIATSGADTEYSDTSANSGSFAVPVLTRSTKGSITITGTVDYAQGPQPKDSNGDDYQTPLPAGSVSASKTFTFIQPFFYGKSASTTISDFTGLTKDVTAKGQKKYKFTTNNEHMVIAYDASYGDLTSILDPNGFETISGWSKSTLTVGGFSYYVWIADSATTDTDAEFTFKF